MPNPIAMRNHIVLIVTVVPTAILLLMLIVAQYVRRCMCLRYMAFVLLHLLDYSTNVAVMLIFLRTNHFQYLISLVPAHLGVGFICIYTAFTSVDFGVLHPIPKFLLTFLVLGLMQGVQIKLTYDDFRAQRSDDDTDAPPMMPARFHCKAMDGLFEGTVFAFVCMYALLKVGWKSEHPEQDDYKDWEVIVLFASGMFSFMTIGLALLEVDHRTSAAAQRIMNSSQMARLGHYLFRVSEVTLRLLTVLMFCTFMRPVEHLYWLSFVGIGIDYLLGVLLLVYNGGEEPVCHSAWLLGIPLFLANVMQFVDAPGMCLQARRISQVLVPFRLVEVLAVVIFFVTAGRTITVHLIEEEVDLFRFVTEKRPLWATSWLVSLITYCLMWIAHARTLQPEADVHSAVAYGEINSLEELLNSDIVVDVNRYGPDGRTPLHLAAVRGHAACLERLIEERANIRARTNDGFKHTALHLAVLHSNKGVDVLKVLCTAAKDDAPLLNAPSSNGDTALHVASRRQNVRAVRQLLQMPFVTPDLVNKAGQTPSQCAVSEKFGYDHNKHFEAEISELFSKRQRGIEIIDESVELALLADASSSTRPSARKPIESSESSGWLEKGSTTTGAASDMSLPEGDAAAGVEKASTSSQHMVPLLSVKPGVEADFLKRSPSMGQSLARRSAAAPQPTVTNVGLSSFMLSAGLGALSKAWLSSIKEEESASGDLPPEVTVKFEDFEEIRKLGEGTFGKVLLVKHKETGNQFALKIMDKQKFKAQKIVSKAHSEQHILKTTRHPCIVSLHYAFQCSTFWALVMDFCPNGDLQDHLGKVGKPGLTLKEVARFGGEVILALEHLHSMQVIFRDMKLENVVLDAGLHAKVTDFGLAKKLELSGEAKTMCGSYGYAAPEIMLSKGSTPYTYAVDLYSFGVMLYMLLSGGEASPSKPEQRLPPMRHSLLRRKLQSCQANPPGEWAQPQVKAMELLLALTADLPQQRTTAAEVKKHTFFVTYLNGPVDALLATLQEEP